MAAMLRGKNGDVQLDYLRDYTALGEWITYCYARVLRLGLLKPRYPLQ